MTTELMIKIILTEVVVITALIFLLRAIVILMDEGKTKETIEANIVAILTVLICTFFINVTLVIWRI